MDFYIPNLEKVKHLLFLPEMKPIEEYPKIVDDMRASGAGLPASAAQAYARSRVDDILNKQFNEFIERNKL